MPDRTDSMDHVTGRKQITPGDFGIAGRAALQGAALGQKSRTRRAVDRAVYPTAAQQRCVGRVDNGVNAQCRDVGDDNFEPRRAELSRREAQAEAAALSSTPLSANSCCNSPAWNISRMISQPPTNSPLT